MTQLTFEHVLHARLSRLNDAIDDWSAMITKLEKLAAEARNGLKARSDTARWEGANADVTRPFVDKTAKEFQDALTQATSIRNILRDALAAFTAAKDALRQIADHPPTGVTIWPDGVVARSLHPDRRGKGNTDPGPSAETLDAVRERIKHAVDQATEADETVARALDDILAGHPYDFGSDRYTSLDDYRRQDRERATKDADAALELAAKGSSLTDVQLARLDALFADNRDDPVFAERFTTGLGARGTFTFYAGITDPRQSPRPSDARIKELGEIQEHLGLVLAQASHGDSPRMRAWKSEVIALGPQVLDLPDHQQAYGFQVMSNLMRDGVYDKRFLNDYGTALVKTDQAMKLPWSFWNGPLVQNNHLNFGADNDFGRDPMTGFLKALSHNPYAATEFFGATAPQDNSQYLLKDRPSFPDGLPESPVASRDATGAALFAAATGLYPDDKHARFVEHTADHRQVLERSLGYLAQTGDDFPPELRDDVAKVLANHGDEVHRATSALDPESSPLDREELLEVSKQISRNQDAYGILNEGLNQEMVRDIHAVGTGDPRETLLRAGHTVGFLEAARYLALETDKEDPSWKAKWGYHLVGGTVGFLPAVGDIAQRGVDVVAYAWQQEEQERIHDKLSDDNNKTFTVRERQLAALADEWAKASPRHPSADDPYILRNDIGGAAYDGNGRAKGLAGAQ
ncbi:hypothetical protein SBI_00301 [Streptomyces bingchenggensis BCW-1]|uniref:DUF6571 domain-containing protein n=1 Tax=Streptomyces bingchenggensis (strain BCW-1) TaxID=749414 RepID=D7BWR6_STRBB|nr:MULTISPECIES: DUF6571 family protein [Streptomyces]ADI03422.1 hypothetical protein SBI_00301 [Streptomyces bingchenggensis BCW-1]